MSSSLHQFLLFWKCDEVKVAWADKQPFITTADSTEARYYDKEFGPIKFKSKKNNGGPKKIHMESRDVGEIQDQAAKLLKIIDIVPYGLIHEPITEEIDD